MRIPKIYLETTMFNFYFDVNREAHSDTVALFREIADKRYEAYTSDYVIDELEKAPEPKKSLMLELLARYQIPVLETNVEAERLANIYVKNSVIPMKYRTDGLHIAVATVNDLDMIISMNFQHIVKRKTVIATGSINRMQGYRALEIYSPMEVIEHEQDE
ncbi:MAG: hypothetical protein FWH26_05015 [Oscillospiraceae bacterium]|nr:hypothetical protein [Oscillospiraceae bacterium]